jgi:hypothetical protein
MRVWANRMLVYWVDSIGRRNTSIWRCARGTGTGLGFEGDGAAGDAVAGAAAGGTA